MPEQRHLRHITALDPDEVSPDHLAEVLPSAIQAFELDAEAAELALDWETLQVKVAKSGNFVYLRLQADVL